MDSSAEIDYSYYILHGGNYEHDPQAQITTSDLGALLTVFMTYHFYYFTAQCPNCVVEARVWQALLFP